MRNLLSRFTALMSAAAVAVSASVLPISAAAEGTEGTEPYTVEIKARDTDTGEYITTYTPGENITYEIDVTNVSDEEMTVNSINLFLPTAKLENLKPSKATWNKEEAAFGSNGITDDSITQDTGLHVLFWQNFSLAANEAFHCEVPVTVAEGAIGALYRQSSQSSVQVSVKRGEDTVSTKKDFVLLEKNPTDYIFGTNRIGSEYVHIGDEVEYDVYVAPYQVLTLSTGSYQSSEYAQFEMELPAWLDFVNGEIVSTSSYSFNGLPTVDFSQDSRDGKNVLTADVKYVTQVNSLYNSVTVKIKCKVNENAKTLDTFTAIATMGDSLSAEAEPITVISSNAIETSSDFDVSVKVRKTADAWGSGDVSYITAYDPGDKLTYDISIKNNKDKAVQFKSEKAHIYFNRNGLYEVYKNDVVCSDDSFNGTGWYSNETYDFVNGGDFSIAAGETFNISIPIKLESDASGNYGFADTTKYAAVLFTSADGDIVSQNILLNERNESDNLLKIGVKNGTTYYTTAYQKNDTLIYEMTISNTTGEAIRLRDIQLKVPNDKFNSADTSGFTVIGADANVSSYEDGYYGCYQYTWQWSDAILQPGETVVIQAPMKVKSTATGTIDTDYPSVVFEYYNGSQQQKSISKNISLSQENGMSFYSTLYGCTDNTKKIPLKRGTSFNLYYYLAPRLLSFSDTSGYTADNRFVEFHLEESLPDWITVKDWSIGSNPGLTADVNTYGNRVSVDLYGYTYYYPPLQLNITCEINDKAVHGDSFTSMPLLDGCWSIGSNKETCSTSSRSCEIYIDEPLTAYNMSNKLTSSKYVSVGDKVKYTISLDRISNKVEDIDFIAIKEKLPSWLTFNGYSSDGFSGSVTTDRSTNELTIYGSMEKNTSVDITATVNNKAQIGDTFKGFVCATDDETKTPTDYGIDDMDVQLSAEAGQIEVVVPNSVYPGVSTRLFAFRYPSANSSWQYDPRTFTTNDGIDASQILAFLLRAENDARASVTLSDYTITDTLPINYNYLGKNSEQYSYPGGLKEPYHGMDNMKFVIYRADGSTEIKEYFEPDISEDGRTLSWSFSGEDFALSPGDSMEFLVACSQGTVKWEGFYTNTVRLNTTADIQEETVVSGKYDDKSIVSTYSFPTLAGGSVLTSCLTEAKSQEGETTSYSKQRVILSQSGETIRYTSSVYIEEYSGRVGKLAIVDRLPYEGDSGVIVSGSRGSEFAVKYMGNIRARITNDGLYQLEPSARTDAETILEEGRDYTIMYSSDAAKDFSKTSEEWNPDYNEGWSGEWTEETKLIRFSLNEDFELYPGDSVEISYDAQVPEMVDDGDVAWLGTAYLFRTKLATAYNEETQEITWEYTTIDGLSVMLAEGAAVGVTVGSGEVSGTVWNDSNDNSVLDDNEVVISDANVTVTNKEDETEQIELTTDYSGQYLVNKLPAGEYTVSVETPSIDGKKSVCTTNNQTADVVVAVNGIAVNDVGFIVSSGSIEGTVWHDSDKDKIIGDAENKLENITVTATSNSDSTKVYTTTTDTNGVYGFADVPEDEYTVTTDTPMINGIEGVCSTDNQITTVSVAANETVTNNVGFYVPTGTISGIVWYDLSKDGVCNEEDADADTYYYRLGDVNVTVTDKNNPNNVYICSTDKSDGSFSFDLPVGEYVLNVDTPKIHGYSTICTTDNQISDVDLTADAAEIFYVGFYPPEVEIPPTAEPTEDPDMTAASIHGTIWNDADRDGVYDDNEEPLSGIDVYVRENTTGDSRLMGIVATDDEGSYSLSGIPSYYGYDITVDNPTIKNVVSAYSASERYAGFSCEKLYYSVDGKYKVLSGQLTTISPVLESGYVYEASAGFYIPSGTITGTVWHDGDKDKSIGDTENKLGGITVTATSNTDSTIAYTTTTDENGAYSFEYIPVDDYTITTDTPTISGTEGICSTENQTTTVSVAADETVTNDVGFYFTMGSIAVFVWNDGDCDKSRSDDEMPIRDVEVSVTNTENEDISYSSMTDDNGNCTIDNIPVGEYRVIVTSPTSEDGTYSCTTDNATAEVGVTDGASVRHEVGFAFEANPTPTPTIEPTNEPTEKPTEAPAEEPTPTVEPTEKPTEEPTEPPTDEPTDEPSEAPTDEPPTTPTAVRICKVDDESLTGLDGAGLKLIKAETNEVIAEWTTDGEYYELTGAALEAGTVYTLIEETAPDGYELADNIQFYVTDEDVLYIVSGDEFIEVEDRTITMRDKAAEPTDAPTDEPTDEPTDAPTDEPTDEPTPTVEPTEPPTDAPSDAPVEEPTEVVTEMPTEEITEAPTEEPTPTIEPTEEPTDEPTDEPTAEPTETPTEEPTEEPTPTATAAVKRSRSGGGGGGSVATATPTPTPTAEPTAKPEDKPELNTDEHFAYIIGYPDDTVRPQNNISREEVATIFFRLLTDRSRTEYWSQNSGFSDMDGGRWSNNAVSTMANAGITDGYDDGTFAPSAPITRAEFAAMAARFDSDTYSGEDKFSDISGHWAEEYINRAAQRGWINGYEDGTFKPNRYITRAEAMTLINRMLNRTPDAEGIGDTAIVWSDNVSGEWYYEAVEEATNSHDYVIAESGERWTGVNTPRDWEQLEKEWSTANSAGTEKSVMYGE